MKRLDQAIFFRLLNTDGNGSISREESHRAREAEALLFFAQL